MSLLNKTNTRVWAYRGFVVKIRRLVLIALVFCSLACVTDAQERRPNQQAKDLAKRALALLDEGKAEASIAQWDKVIAADSSYTPYRYEKCVALVLVKRYDQAIEELLPIYRDTLLFDRGYQLIGNCYDMKNDSVNSAKYYREGLAAWPNSGRLHYEMGAAALFDGKGKEAVDWWIKGTQVEPTLGTNYYWIAKTYANSKDRIWTCMYGEIFLNLETNTERTREISKLVFDAWNASLRLGDTTDPIRLASDETLSRRSTKGADVGAFPYTFEIQVAQMAIPLTPDKGVLSALTIEQLVRLRIGVAKQWKKVKYDTLYDNSIMKWHVKLLDAGWLEQYLWLLYSWGNVNEMRDHYKKNETRYDTFLAWLGTHNKEFYEPSCGGYNCD